MRMCLTPRAKGRGIDSRWCQILLFFCLYFSVFSFSLFFLNLVFKSICFCVRPNLTLNRPFYHETAPHSLYFFLHSSSILSVLLSTAIFAPLPTALVWELFFPCFYGFVSLIIFPIKEHVCRTGHTTVTTVEDLKCAFDVRLLYDCLCLLVCQYPRKYSK